MRIRKLAALTAVAVTLVTAPGAHAQPTTTAKPSRPNSQPPAVDRKFLPAFAEPKEDVDYKKKVECVTSGTGDRTIENKPWGQMQLRLEEAHRFATGKDVKLAIIDTGVNAEHPRLKGRVIAGGDYVETAEKGAKDCDGHGTGVAGVAAASRDDRTGFVGAAPDAQVISIRQTSNRYAFEDKANPANSRPSAGRVGTLAQAIVAAVRQGAQVINISLTSCARPQEPSTQERELQAAIDWAVNDEDVVVVTAAGNIDANSGCEAQNDNEDTNNVNVVASPPWYADNVLSVASISQVGEVSAFSVWGPWVSVAAPGEEITTLDPAGQGLTNANVDTNGRTTAIQGTSFASPYVAGVAAMVRERFPDLTARQVMDRIKATAQHPGNPTGRDRKVGFGMVNPVAALTAELPMERPGAKPAAPEQVMTSLDPLNPPDRTPMVVALSGTGAGVGLLLLTLFIVHTVNRNRARRAAVPVKRSVL
ncbi:type VII secretion-associated serine protease mycosin [Saccharothrix syringae]|uniref:Type VII secretion-associated serine protease mycosin n=1 Tax=Saccharothrix syringae TaxID=103733 RepID=A0A5Q0HGI4_SACSY|nr:type VII secretion-associated serine protease mycosin [Saccharothrix syringae]QFZ24872.1 type VII secretion-associated serine protease mycosin [Saccharothrix syringae]